MKRLEEGRRKTREITYVPGGSVKHPLQMLKEMWRDVLVARELGWQLAVRDIKAQYRQTFLGYVWAFVPPVIIGITLSVASNNRVVNFGEAAIPYTAYVIIGVVLWQTFIESITLQIQAVSKSKEMLSKLNFPREGLILSGLVQVVFSFVIKFTLVVLVVIWYDIQFTSLALLVPFALAILLILGTGIGLLLAPVGGLFEDVGRGVIVSSTALLIVTPVVFVPPDDGLFATVVSLNPITPIIVTLRDLLTTGDLTHTTGFLFASVFSISLFVLAWASYRIAMPIIIERMNA